MVLLTFYNSGENLAYPMKSLMVFYKLAPLELKPVLGHFKILIMITNALRIIRVTSKKGKLMLAVVSDAVFTKEL